MLTDLRSADLLEVKLSLNDCYNLRPGTQLCMCVCLVCVCAPLAPISHAREGQTQATVTLPARHLEHHADVHT